jgi:mannose-6-phosphate isomerase
LKFLFPTEKLSIQVHPNDAYAQAREKAAGGRGKTEMWHVVSAQTKAQVLVGLKPGVNRDKFLEGLERNKLEELFEAYPVYAGDTLFVPAGTPHTIGPGMVICEIQEYSDLTYRVYDYGRLDPQGQPRELHIEKALEVTRFGKSLGGKVAPLQLENEGATKRLLAACRYFATERWECSARCEICIDPARFELVVILNGSGALSWQGGSARFQRGECWIVPASQRNLALLPEGPLTVVRSYVPDVAVLRAELHRAGISAAALSQVVFD